MQHIQTLPGAHSLSESMSSMFKRCFNTEYAFNKRLIEIDLTDIIEAAIDHAPIKLKQGFPIGAYLEYILNVEHGVELSNLQEFIQNLEKQFEQSSDLFFEDHFGNKGHTFQNALGELRAWQDELLYDADFALFTQKLKTHLFAYYINCPAFFQVRNGFMVTRNIASNEPTRYRFILEAF